jgi:two-component system LytT family response regulator/two-component system response regulator LytT
MAILAHQHHATVLKKRENDNGPGMTDNFADRLDPARLNHLIKIQPDNPAPVNRLASDDAGLTVQLRPPLGLWIKKRISIPYRNKAGASLAIVTAGQPATCAFGTIWLIYYYPLFPGYNLENGERRQKPLMTLTALIVDDEQPARDELAFLLEDIPEVEVVGQGKNGLEAVSLIRDLEPQLVFLDVQMPGLDGFGVIKKVLDRNLRLPCFVFVTAYDQYAVQAFEVNALDYLLKPIAKPRLEKAIAKVRRIVESAETASEKLDRLVQMVEERPLSAPQKNKIVVKSGGRLILVDADDIIYASIQDGVISVVARDLEGVSNFRTVEELQTNLDPKTFWRVHRSYLVNINRIKEVVPWFKSSYQLKMDDRKQTEIPVSRAQTRKLREFLNL